MHLRTCVAFLCSVLRVNGCVLSGSPPGGVTRRQPGSSPPCRQAVEEDMGDVPMEERAVTVFRRYDNYGQGYLAVGLPTPPPCFPALSIFQ